MHNFQVGDRVVCLIDNIEGNRVLREGDEGTVCHVPEPGDYCFGVRWDRGDYQQVGHNCKDHCEEGYGWYIYPSNHKYLDYAPGFLPEVDTSIDLTGVSLDLLLEA